MSIAMYVYSVYDSRIQSQGRARHKIQVDMGSTKQIHKASGEMSPRVFRSKALMVLNADFVSSPNSERESMVSYAERLNDYRQSVIEQRTSK